MKDDPRALREDQRVPTFRFLRSDKQFVNQTPVKGRGDNVHA
jgi:hypothetical protein